MTRVSGTPWAYYPHDTGGLGRAGVHAACEGGVRVFDAATAGLDGCPLAPGATLDGRARGSHAARARAREPASGGAC